MAAGSEALVLKVSADTSDVATGLAPMTAGLDKLAQEANAAEKELRGLSDVDVSIDGITTMTHQLDGLEDEIDATRDAMQDLGGTEVKLRLKEQAISDARDRIGDLRDQLAKEVTLGLDTKDTQRKLSDLQTAVRKLTDTPAVVPVDVDIDDEELAGIESLREGALGMGEALGNAGQSMSSFADIGREAVPLLADLNTTMVALKAEAAATGGSMGKLGTGVSKVTSLMAGPWGLAIAAGVGLLTAFASQSDATAEATANFTDEIDVQAGALDKHNREIAAKKLEDAGALELADALGISTQEMTSAVLGNVDAYRNVTGKLAAYRMAMDDSGTASGAWKDINAEALDSVTNLFHQVEQGIPAAERMSRAVGDVGSSTSDAADTLGSLADGVSYQASLWKDFGDRIDESRKSVDDMIRSVDILNGRFASAREATLNYEQAVDDANQSIEDNGKAVTKNGAAFDANTEAGRKNEKALMDMAKAADDMARARLADADASGESSDQILADYAKQRDALIQTAIRMGLSKDAATKYADALLKTPKDIKTQVGLTGYNEAEADMKQLTKDRTATVHIETQLEKYEQLPQRIKDAISGNGTVGLNVYAPPAPAPQPAGLTLLQPRLYLDSRPIRAALRNDVTSTVAAQLAATRNRGRL